MCRAVLGQLLRAQMCPSACGNSPACRYHLELKWTERERRRKEPVFVFFYAQPAMMVTSRQELNWKVRPVTKTDTVLYMKQRQTGWSRVGPDSINCCQQFSLQWGHCTCNSFLSHFWRRNDSFLSHLWRRNAAVWLPGPDHSMPLRHGRARQLLLLCESSA